MVSTDILLAGTRHVCCVASKPRIEQTSNIYDRILPFTMYDNFLINCKFNLSLFIRQERKRVRVIIIHLTINDGQPGK
jgi:hypothetical protein